MNMSKVPWISEVSFIVFAFLLLYGQFSYSSEYDEEVRAAAEEFYTALNYVFKGDIEPMTEVWSHSHDITYMGPAGGILVGWKEVRNSWEEQAKLKLGGEIKPIEMKIIAGESIGITVNYEQGAIYINGKTEGVNIRATNVFRRENGKWKMVGHHTDIIPRIKI